MTFFRYRADIIPITLFVSFFLCDIFVYFSLQNIPWLLPYVAVSLVIKGFICAWNHHHQHALTFHSPALNRLLEIVYGFQTGLVGYVWVLHHNLGHHIHYLDQSQDESAWKAPDGHTYGPLMYTWIVSITAYPRAWRRGSEYPKIRKYLLTMGLIQLFLLAILIAYNPLSGALIFLLPMITGIVLTVYATYFHHATLDTQDPYKASHNILQPWYNFLTGNLGYHTAHHIKGGLHWSKLPEFHKEIESKIESVYYKKWRLWISE